jgi:hypothetical protein
MATVRGLVAVMVVTLPVGNAGECCIVLVKWEKNAKVFLLDFWIALSIAVAIVPAALSNEVPMPDIPLPAEMRWGLVGSVSEVFAAVLLRHLCSATGGSADSLSSDL